jgi:hypothetical protein
MPIKAFVMQGEYLPSSDKLLTSLSNVGHKRAYKTGSLCSQALMTTIRI